MDVARYLARLDLFPTDDRSPARLATLHDRHLLAIPFENLDVRAQRPISLDANDLFEKIIVRRRGGFCYELNGLFALLLEGMGFSVKRVAAAVMKPDGTFGMPMGHLALIVSFPDGDRLADVGFGDTFRKPVLLRSEVADRQYGVEYRVVPEGDAFEYRRFDAAAGDWVTQYRFGTEPRALADFAESCVFQSTSPESIFVQRTVCSKAIPDGRITLTHEKLILTRGVRREEKEIASEADFARALATHFSIDYETIRTR